MIDNTLSLAPFGPTMLNHLWQSTVFVAAVWLVTLLLRKNPARIRSSLWLVASLKFLIPFSLLIGFGSLLPKPLHVEVNTPTVVYFAADAIGQPFTDLSISSSSATHPASFAERFITALPPTLAAVWLCGVVIVLLIWSVRWWQVSTLLRRAVPLQDGREIEILRRLDGHTQVPMRASQELMEPGIFGIRRPVLVWPKLLTERLEDEHIAAILSHELMHVRRRDNLIAMLHMAVEAVFWFHPLVWWMERRMIEERERACDEAVVQMGGRPEIYAESLLKACRFCLESPLTCIAGVTGADLKMRVRSIMTLRLEKLSLDKKMALVAFGLITLAGPVAFGVMRMIPLYGQILHADGTRPSFAVVSVRPGDRDTQPSVIEVRSDGIVTPYGTTLKAFIMWAYNVAGDSQFTGGPGWIRSTRFDIQAKVDEAKAVELSKLPLYQREGQMRLMAQSLLEERFKLKASFLTKEQAVYELTVAKGGLKCPKAPSTFASAPKPGFSPAPPPPPPPPPPSPEMTRSDARQFHMKAAPMWFVAHFLSYEPEFNGHIVLDKTDVEGPYSIDLSWSRDSTENSDPSLFTAVQEQLGLKLTPTRGRVEVLAVDHLEMPSAN